MRDSHGQPTETRTNEEYFQDENQSLFLSFYITELRLRVEDFSEMCFI